MDLITQKTVTTAASLSGLAFFFLIISVPLMLNNISKLEYDLSSQHKVYLQLSNKMWDELMTQSNVLLTPYLQNLQRQKRQYDSSNIFTQIKCAAGLPGLPGIQGDIGPSGKDGLPGLPGKSGDIDLQNADGYSENFASSCPPCAPGPPGLPGYKGKRGPRGEKGAKGEKGSPGCDGANGEEGLEGDVGFLGAQGAVGEKGEPGEDGVGQAFGSPGLAGPDGMPGLEGESGLQGERGDIGPIGEPGKIGPPGEKGKKGRNGDMGLPGVSGTQGSDAEYCPCPRRSNESSSTVSVSNNVYNTNDNSDVNTPSSASLKTSNDYQSVASRRFAAYNKLARAVALRRRHF